MKPRLSRGILAGLLCAAAIAAISLIDKPFLGAEWLLFDAFTRRIAATRRPDPRIVIVNVGEQTIANLSADFGRPPYPRTVYADAIAELQRAGASVIGVDIAFSEEDRDHPEADRRLAEVLSNAPVVLGADTEPGPSVGLDPFRDRYWRIDGAPPSHVLYDPRSPLPAFAGATIGTMRIVTAQHSAAIRDYNLADRVGANEYVPSLALEMYRRARGLPARGTWSENALAFEGLRIPLDDRGAFSIRWHGAQGSAAAPSKSASATTRANEGSTQHDEGKLTYKAVGLDKVLLASMAHDDPSVVPPDRLAAFEKQFRGAIVLIGYTAVGLLDLRATPLSATTAGVELHANAIDDLLHQEFNRDAPRPLVLAILLLLGASLGFLFDRTRSQLASGAIAIVALAATAATGYALLRSGIVIPTVAIALAIALTYIVITVLNFVAEQHQTAVLRTTFGRYVSPQILVHILAHPEKVRLGGERRDLTILFSDIRGFTSISEASEPEQVVEMLNEYLTKMVDILLAHGGTLDKFIGDAVMGFWNAPAPNADHARNAVRCAIEMIDETARLRARWETEGKASIRIGIGINTGDAVAGNIGAEQVFGYTVIGDAVNLASRLESKNKDYGTEIIISEFTLARIGEAFETVYLDDVKVKGKENAVKIYEVKGPKHA
ncbi:MAG: adenylate/guanylate cyclase domain-containing protein [Acidobacteriota bacterium]